MVDILFYVFAAVAHRVGASASCSAEPGREPPLHGDDAGLDGGIFVLLEAHFLAAIQIIVYAGAIMVLFLFVIMLLNLGHDYQRDLKGGVFALILSFGVVGRDGGSAGPGARQPRTPLTLRRAGRRSGDRRGATPRWARSGVIAEPLYTRRTWCPSRSPGSCSWSPSSARWCSRSGRWSPMLITGPDTSQRDPLRDRHLRRPRAPERDHHVPLHRAAAQRGEPLASWRSPGRWGSTARSSSSS